MPSDRRLSPRSLKLHKAGADCSSEREYMKYFNYNSPTIVNIEHPDTKSQFVRIVPTRDDGVMMYHSFILSSQSCYCFPIATFSATVSLSGSYQITI